MQTAPVAEDGKLYFTCFDGSAFCLDAERGNVIWKNAASGTSAPLVARGRLILSTKQGYREKASEGISRLSSDEGAFCATGLERWKAEARGKNISRESQLFSPPALGGKNLYLCSQQGHFLSVRQSDGAVNFMYATGQAMAFQPTLAKGNMYAGTNNGRLICLRTEDLDADGWYCWGGNAQHNKVD